MFRFACWLLFAIIICWPAAFSSSLLIGDERIDVWNHAWGYWYVYQSLLEGFFPLETSLVGAPKGGSLYFIDTPGAMVALPITHFFGAAVAYNWILIIRIALCGLAAQLLAKELSFRGYHTWIAGVAYASTPFLLCELNNGISEVCAMEWIAFSLWATLRVLKTHRWRDWMLLGLIQGLNSTATFYYGLAGALILLPIFVCTLFFKILRQHSIFRYLVGCLLAVVVSLVVFFPHGYAFWNSIHREDRLIIRDVQLHDQLLRHNAVDPSVYIRSGNFQSVDLLKEYGEPFIHTGYLRWSILILALCAFLLHKRSRRYLPVAMLSLLLGMGSYLWFGGEWVYVNGQLLSLPFDWLRQVLPQIAITHPLRLSIGAQALFCAFAAVGAGVLIKRGLPRISLAVLAGLIFCESIFASAAQWPLQTSDASISELYTKADDRAVLDLPAEVGTSMKTSRYFWYQTLHQSPIPYTPDVRLGSAKDPKTFNNFIASDGFSEEPRVPKGLLVEHMKQTYGLIVLHPELDATLAKAYDKALTPAFGKPQKYKELLYWILEESTAPLVDDSSQNTSLSAEEPVLSECATMVQKLNAIKQGTDIEDNEAHLLKCGSEFSSFCLRWAKKNDISQREALICIEGFLRNRIEGDADALIQLLRRNEDPIRKAAANALIWRDLTEEHKLRIQSVLDKERIPAISRMLKEAIAR